MVKVNFYELNTISVMTYGWQVSLAILSVKKTGGF